MDEDGTFESAETSMPNTEHMHEWNLTNSNGSQEANMEDVCAPGSTNSSQSNTGHTLVLRDTETDSSIDEREEVTCTQPTEEFSQGSSTCHDDDCVVGCVAISEHEPAETVHSCAWSRSDKQHWLNRRD